MAEIDFYADSDKGGKIYNFDALCWEKDARHPYFILADGVGSARLSGFAAWMGVKKTSQELKMELQAVTSEQELKAAIQIAIERANQLVISINQRALELTRAYRVGEPRVWSVGKKDKYGLDEKIIKEINSYAEGTTTLDLGVFYDEKLYTAHIGDGRIYVLIKNGNHIQQITDDENDAYSLWEQRKITDKEELKVHPLRSSLNNVLGSSEKNIKINMPKEISLKDITSVLALTDGFYDRLTDAEIEQALKTSGPLENKFKALLTIAHNPVGIAEVIKKNHKYKLANDSMTGILAIIK